MLRFFTVPRLAMNPNLIFEIGSRVKFFPLLRLLTYIRMRDLSFNRLADLLFLAHNGKTMEDK